MKQLHFFRRHGMALIIVITLMLILLTWWISNRLIWYLDEQLPGIH